MQVDADNPQFDRAVAVVNHTSRHLFLTGKAGTGKTTFLKYIRDHTFKKLAVVAPTGVAAINAGGMTIHSFFQLPFGTFIANGASGWGETNNPVFNTNQLLGKLRIHRKKADMIRELELLIIDEISMVRADVLDAMDMVLRHIRRKQHIPFGGLQMVYIGDLFQLPPVVKNEDWMLLQPHYQGPFFFHARAIAEAPPLYLELKKIYRQDDPRFISLLNKVRTNCCGDPELQLLEQHYQPNFIPDAKAGYITLTSHNYLADRINQRELEKLTTKKYELAAEVEREFPESAFPADKNLVLKEGAQIIFLKNDKSEDRRYFNGKTGIVQRIDRPNDKIYIRFPGETDLLELSKEIWYNIRYQYDAENQEIKETEIGSFRQFPIRLAWAVTIHKSQGLTFSRAIIDAGRAFAPGQVYVALSRLTGLEGMVLHSRITPGSIQTNGQVIAFAQREPSEEELNATLQQEQQLFLQQTVLSAFHWDKELRRLDQFAEQTGKGKAQDRLLETGWISQLRTQLLELQQVGFTFIRTLEKLIRDPAHYARLHQRTQDAARWFGQAIEEKILVAITGQTQALKTKGRTKKKRARLDQLAQAFTDKQWQLNQAVVITRALHQQEKPETLLKAATDLYHPPVATPAGKKGEKQDKEAKATIKGSTRYISLTLYQANKSPVEIARERDLKPATILGHLVTFIPTGEVEIGALFEEKEVAAIRELIEDHPEASNAQIIAKSGGQYTHPAVQAVRLLLEKQNA